MKKLLYLLTVVVMFAMTACSDKDDEPVKVVEDENITWLKNNIVGEWHAPRIYNSISGVWVSSSIGYPDNKMTFDANGTVTIKDFHSLNGTHTYSFTTKNGQTMLKIGDKEIGILSVTPSSKKFTLFNFAQMEKS